MAKVYLLSVAPPPEESYDRGAFRRLKESAAQERFDLHHLVDDPADADLIIFAELQGAGPYFEKVRRHPLVRRQREKCFIFSCTPYAIPFLPGIYTSVEQRWAGARTRGGFYLGVSENEFVTYAEPNDNLPWLYSFLGSTVTAPVRRSLSRLSHPRGFFQDTAADQQRVLAGEFTVKEMLPYWHRYAESIRTSKFVLCPRGVSPSSVRLFDTMRMGRVPVILSDGWLAPSGPVWDQFSLRVPENSLDRLLPLLEEREADAPALGRRARAVWEEWFSPPVCFHRVVEWCLEIKGQQRFPESFSHLKAYFQYLRPSHFRHRLRTRYREVRGR
ncbi:MAG: exostosin domain-containing protein [Chthoniobacterales bacterium]